MTKYILKAFIVGALLIANQAYASEIPLLNHNFESDAIPPSPGWTTHISGWVSGGYGEFGVHAPGDNNNHYTSIGNRGQIAYLNAGARIYQTASTSLLLNETYTLTFDVGQRINHDDLHFVARIKAKGLVIAQLSSSEIDLIPGGWTTTSLSFTATSTMPIGEPVVVEFNNLTRAWNQVNIDNVFLSTAGTGTTAPGINLGTPTMIMEDRTLLVPDQYPNINVALRYLDDKQIKTGKTVTIKVTDCTNQIYSESVNVAHPNGDSIHIVGNTSNPELCTLQFNNTSGLVLENGSKLAGFDGFSLNGSNNADTNGIHADKNALLANASNLIISNFENGVLVTNNSSLIADNVISKNNSAAGFSSVFNSYIYTSNSLASLNYDGYYTAHNSTQYVSESSALNNSHSGFTAGFKSQNSIKSSTSSSNGDNFIPDRNTFANNASLNSFY